MLYPKCPTCGTVLAEVTTVLHFEEKLKEICNNPNLNDKEKDEAKSKLVQSMGLKRYCCRMRLITAVDLAKIVI